MTPSAPLLEGTLIAEQRSLELKSVDEGAEQYRALVREASARGDAASLKPGQRLMLRWLSPYCTAIKRELRKCRRGIPGNNRHMYAPVLTLLPATSLAVIAMHTTIGECLKPRETPNKPARFSTVAGAIGRAVILEAQLAHLKADRPDNFRDLSEYCRRNQCTLARATARKPRDWWGSRSLDDSLTSGQVTRAIGGMLFWLLIDSATDEDKAPLPFRHSQHKSKPSTVQPTSALLNAIATDHAFAERLRPLYCPMIIPPLRWSDRQAGGYVTHGTRLIPSSDPAREIAMMQANLSPAYDGLNAVNAQSFRINRGILPIVQRYFDSGGGAIGVPPSHFAPLPSIPDSFDTDEARRAWKTARRKAKIAQAKQHSTRQEFLNKLAMAERFASRDALWFPHQLDFRGRAYPIPPHLNHQGDDVCRGLIEFAEGKPLRTSDRFWLKVHAANCYGQDKGTFAERAAWVDAHMQAIGASAANPLSVDFWTHADETSPGKKDGKPWQFLAACMALVDGDAAAHLPIQFDGTCNGLQHYAALGRCPQVASQVNMMKADKPGDAYASVAAAVLDRVSMDIAEGASESLTWTRLDGAVDAKPLNEIAAAAQLQVDRRLIKQPVMTFFYGATDVGTRRQLQSHLRSAMPAPLDYLVSRYLSRITRIAIACAYSQPVAIMHWLRSCAVAIAATGKTIEWVTPLGLPVVQTGPKYQHLNKVSIYTLGNRRLILRQPDATAKINKKKQIAGFAPNFIHSLDAAHMLATAAECHAHHIAFAAAHDCYWTHAATAKPMNDILRNQFVRLHSTKLLTSLHAELSARYSLPLPKPPPVSTFDIGEVKEAPYFFS